MSGLVVVRLPGSDQIQHIMCLPTFTSDFTPKIVARPGAEYWGVNAQIVVVCFMEHYVPSDTQDKRKNHIFILRDIYCDAYDAI